MSDISLDQKSARPGLGIGAIIAESFSICGKTFPAVIALSIPAGLLFAVDLKMHEAPGSTIAGSVLVMLASVVAGAISSALLVQLAYDAKLSRPLQPGRYIRSMLDGLLPIVLLTVAVTFIVLLGLSALVVPGLWASAVFSMMVPAVVIERAGFSALSRSAHLTRGYRWPIVILVVFVMIIDFALNFVAGFVQAFVAGSTTGVIFSFCLALLCGTASAGLSGIILAVVYARLREIKEGIGVDEIAAVFE